MNAAAQPEVTIERLNAEQALAAVPALADVLLDCVEGGASVSFMWPLPREKALAFWTRVAQGVSRGERVLLVAREAAGSGEAADSGEAGGGRIVGTVQLLLDMPDNQPHRGDVAKMLVHRRARRRGIAQRLMAAVEAEARVEKRSVLVLDTVTGGDAERLYARAGWQRVGTIPGYALMPDGALCATTYFHRQLAGN